MSEAAVKKIETANDYASLVKGAPIGLLVVVDFYAEWCGPCKTIGPKLEEMAKSNKGKFIAFKVDVDDLDELAVDEGVAAMPTFVFYKDGEKVDSLVGASESKLQSKIQQYS